MLPIDDLPPIVNNLTTQLFSPAPSKNQQSDEEAADKKSHNNLADGVENDLTELRNQTQQLRRDLFQKLNHGANRENRTGREDRESLHHSQRQNVNKGGIGITLDIAEATATVLGLFKRAAVRYAAQAGLDAQKQIEFAEQQTKHLVDHAKAKGVEKQLEKAGDLTALNEFSDLFQAEVKGNQVEVILKEKVSQGLNEARQLPSLISNQNLPQAQLPSHRTLHLPNNQHALNLKAQAATSLPLTARFGELKGAINHKAEAILRFIGIEVRAAHAKAGQSETFEPPLLGSQPLGGENTDTALFATALGIAAEFGSQSRAIHGDGLLLEFVNYSGTGNVNDDAILLNLLQKGTTAGVDALIETINSDFTDFALDGLTALNSTLEVETPAGLVIGLITMSVMTREVVDQLNNILDNAGAGLSDSAMSALLKAQNSLRDHLDTGNLIGALAEAKNNPLSVEGFQYNFGSEVSEALNALREARSRILTEATSVKGDMNGADSQTRFIREADALLGITQRIENFLKTR